MEGIRAVISVWFEFVTFEHTVFALPFAYLGAVLAYQGIPPFSKWLWITLAMVGARTGGMSLNRLVDREMDAQNPRTKERPLQKGLISLGQARALVFASLTLFLFSAWQLNPLCVWLSPFAFFLLFLYSYVKRFSWGTHFVLGLVLACAPVGGWVAVTGELSFFPFLLGGAVFLWVAGFDVIYACQDVSFDRSVGIHSLPARFGVAPALWCSTLLHVASLLCLFGAGLLGSLGLFFWLGWGVAASILLVEHRLISPHNLSRINQAFFVMNGWVSVVLFTAVFCDRLWSMK